MFTEKFYSTAEAAAILNTHDWHIRGLLRLGLLRGTKISRKSWRIPESALNELIERGSNAKRSGAEVAK